MKLFLATKNLLLVIFLLCATNGNAQKKYEWKSASSKGYAYKYVTNDPMQTRFYTLENGLTVILSANHKEPRIAYRMAIRAGSNNDPKNHTGLAHYLEHLLFKGTDRYGSLDWAKEKPLLDQIDELYEQYGTTNDAEKRKEIYKAIDKISGEAAKYAIAGEYNKLMLSIGSQATNAHTSVDETVYEEDIPANTIDKLLAVQAERFRNPSLRIFHTELEAVYEEKNRGLDNDDNKMQEAMFTSVFPTHNYGLQSTIGTIEHLKNPSIKAIREFYNKYYVPNNMAVVLSGDFIPDEIIYKIDKAFAYMQPKQVAEYVGPKQVPIVGPIVKEVYGPTAEQIRILYRVAAAGSREAFLASMLSSILSNGKAGLLDLNLNKQQKLLSAQAGIWQFKDYGIFLAIAVPKQGQSLDEAKSLILSQINKLRQGDFDESLIKAIVANSKLQLLRGLENNNNRVNSIKDEFIHNRGIEWDKSVAKIEAMGKITKKELVEFANNFFGDSNYVLLYKRKGEDKNTTKVEKPPITPVENNAGKTSPFVQSIISTPVPAFKPVWLDYSKDIQKRKIGNAEVLYVQNKDNSLFRLTYNFDMGSWNNKLLPVAAQYLNYLGTEKYSSEAISKEFYNLACNFNVAVSNEETVISISGLQENFVKAVQLFETLINNCKPDTGALAGLKNLLQKSRSDNKSRKQAVSVAMQSYAFYGSKNPFNYVLSNNELKNLNSEELTALLHTLGQYKHTITYYGPQLFPGLTATLQNIHKLPAKWRANENAIKFASIDQKTNQVLFTDYNAVQAEIYWIKNLEKYDPKEEALINVFNNYFGDGMGSVVFNTIRGSKALAYATYAFVRIPLKQADKFAAIAYVGCQADKMNEAVAAMNELLNELPKTDQNFENSKSSLLKDIETERVLKSNIIGSYQAAQKKGLGYDIRKENYARYNTIQFNDLYLYHKQQLANKPYTYCIIGSDKKINTDDLKKYGTLKVLNQEELFGY